MRDRVLISSARSLALAFCVSNQLEDFSKSLADSEAKASREVPYIGSENEF